MIDRSSGKKPSKNKAAGNKKQKVEDKKVIYKNIKNKKMKKNKIEAKKFAGKKSAVKKSFKNLTTKKQVNKPQTFSENSLTSDKKPLVLIVGISGSGLSTAVHALEDRGFYVIDNLPLDLIPATAKLLREGDYGDRPGFAFGLHIQNPMTRVDFTHMTENLRAEFHLDVVFLEANREVIARRYGASRRPHPLAYKSHSLESCIELEKGLLSDFRSLADIVIDTSDMSPYVLARFFESRYSGQAPSRRLLVAIQSFGFKHGPLQPAEGIFDVRYLSNPYFVGSLAEKNGNDSEVLEFLKNDLRFEETIRRLTEWHAWVLPQFFEDGRTYYRLGIGCTGGKHRSVAVAEGLYAALQGLGLDQISLAIHHRDINLK